VNSQVLYIVHFLILLPIITKKSLKKLAMEYPKNPSIEIVEDSIVFDKVTDKENDEDPIL
jgi:hypothetical protein